MSDPISNYLLWGVWTDEEVKRKLEEVKLIEEQLKKEGKWFEIKGDNPYIKPKSEWTDEMKQNWENYKNKYNL